MIAILNILAQQDKISANELKERLKHLTLMLIN